ncbi:MAG: hypothetical protein ACLQVF_13035 [Isosphaeraceae bacterium]
MSRSRVFWLRLVFLMPLATFGVGIPFHAHAQAPGLDFEQIIGNTRGIPELPPQGAWGEVINVTPRWLVIQNHSGQQFPISVDDIGTFLIRWPSSIANLGPRSVVEAVGISLGSNLVETPHIDVFEGADRTLIQPTYDTGFDGTMLNWVFNTQNNLLNGWAYPLSSGTPGTSTDRLHVVGTVVERSPLRLSIPGNNVATVVPAANVQLTVTQVTRGSINAARKGDFAFIMPMSISSKGLVVSQLVLYKTVPLGRLNNPAR